VANRSRSGTGGEDAVEACALVLIVAEYMSECPIVASLKSDLTPRQWEVKVDSQTIIVGSGRASVFVPFGKTV
jgi:hypothetical protein